MEKPDFLHVDTNSWKIEVVLKTLGWTWSKSYFNNFWVVVVKNGHSL